MKRRVRVTVVLMSAAPLLAAAGWSPAAAGPAASASGLGSISFGLDGDGRGVFDFRVEVGPGPEITGKVTFAAEHHHEALFPDIVVRLGPGQIDRASIEAGVVKITGDGALHEEPVRVIVKAIDSGSATKPDRFSIKCKNSQGLLVLDAEGDVTIGDILVGEAD